MTTKLENVARIVVASLLAASGCDIDSNETEVDEMLDAEDLRSGCVYPAVAPERDLTYWSTAGASTGGCDLHIGERVTYYPVGGRLFRFEAVSDKPFSEWSAVVWGRQCEDYDCGPWTKYEASPQNVWQETGYCYPAQWQVPCIYKLTVHLQLPANAEYDNFRIGHSAFDEDGDPVFMRHMADAEY